MQSLIPYFILDLVILVMAVIGCAQKKSIANLILLILGSFGCVLALALTWEHYNPGTLPCSIHSSGCTATLASSYGMVGPIPTSIFGLGMYALFALLAWKRKQLLNEDRMQEEIRIRAYSAATTSDTTSDAVTTPSETGARRDPDRSDSPVGATTPLKTTIARLDQGIWFLALAGIGISWWLQYVALFKISTFCPYCFTSAITVTAIMILASRDYLFEGRTITGEQKLLMCVVSFVLVLLSTIALPDLYHRLEDIMKHKDTPKPTVVAELLRNVVIRPGLNSKGDPKAKFTLVEFADYNCPHCKEASEKLPELIKKHPEIRLIFRNYPLGFPRVKFQRSDKAAIAAEAAALQGKFWEMHDYLFEHQNQMKDPNLTDDMFIDFARDLGMNPDKFKQDFEDQKTLTRVIQDHDDGDRTEMDMTPTFFLVTPDQVTRFVGVQDLEKIMNNPNDKAWK